MAIGKRALLAASFACGVATLWGTTGFPDASGPPRAVGRRGVRITASRKQSAPAVRPQAKDGNERDVRPHAKSGNEGDEAVPCAE